MEIKELYQAMESKFGLLDRRIDDIVGRQKDMEAMLRSTAEKVASIKECLDLDRRQITLLDDQHEILDDLKLDLSDMTDDVENLKRDVSKIRENQ
jgi:prefoldin subunit 5